jgi:FlaG/FlaF family flagellin (archaellin)
MFEKSRSDAAIGDTIGTIIMVAIVFVAAGFVSSFVLNYYGSVEEDVYAGVQFVTDGDGAVEVVWTERGTADYLRVTNGTTTRQITSLGSSTSMWFGPQKNDVSVIAVGVDGTETFITKFESPSFTSSLYARSQSCDSGSGCDAHIVLNDTGSSMPTGTGLNILVFESTGEFDQHAYFDMASDGQYRPTTYSLDGSGQPAVNGLQPCSTSCFNQARAYFDGLGSGQYIVVVSGGDAGDVPDSLQEVFDSFGAQYSNDNVLETNDSWIISTQKTCDSACPEDEYRLVFEEHAPSPDQTGGVDHVDAYFYAPDDR